MKNYIFKYINKITSILYIFIFSFISSSAYAHSSSLPPLKLPERSLPVPTTVSPSMQEIIAKPYAKIWDQKPDTIQGWQKLIDTQKADASKAIPALLKQFKVDLQRQTIGEVPVFILTPQNLKPENKDRILLNMHGGCYVINGGEAGLPEAIFMAGFGGYKVISVDYRMPPVAYFPAALDDGMTVWKQLLQENNPKKIGLFGTSAGGALVLQMMHKAKMTGLAAPAAIAAGTPMSDLTKHGDTFYTNEMIDNILVSRDGFCDAAAKFYANGHDLADPLLSPVYGDMSGFPPTILTSGTRDLLLSNTVRVHRKLRQANIPAELHVYEGQSHAHYIQDANAPETKEAFEEIAKFFDRYLAK